MLDPTEGVEQVQETARHAAVPISAATLGDTRTYGDVTLQVLWPDLPGPVVGGQPRPAAGPSERRRS